MADAVKTFARRSATAMEGVRNPEIAILKLAAKVAQKLNKAVKQGHQNAVFFFIAILAIIKDWADAPAQADFTIVVRLILFFITALITIFMFRKGWFFFKKSRLRIVLWFISLFIDIVPILGFAPMITLNVLITWHSINKTAKKAQQNLVELKQKTKEELMEINAEYAEFGDKEQDTESELRAHKRGDPERENGVVIAKRANNVQPEAPKAPGQERNPYMTPDVESASNPPTEKAA